jgi:hypothetical protein
MVLPIDRRLQRRVRRQRADTSVEHVAMQL